MLNKTLILPLFVLIMMFSSCTNENIISETSRSLTEEWNRNQTLEYDLDIKDTTQVYSINCILRNSHDYQFCNLYLKYQIEDETGKTVNSNFQELLLYSPQSGSPLGKEQILSDIQEGSYPLIPYIKFKSTGVHKLKVKHQMRDNQELGGLETVGIQLVKFTN